MCVVHAFCSYFAYHSSYNTDLIILGSGSNKSNHTSNFSLSLVPIV